jgi:hypothetical protein
VEIALAEQLLVDVHLFIETQAVGHSDQVNTVDECFVSLIVPKLIPLLFVRLTGDKDLSIAPGNDGMVRTNFRAPHSPGIIFHTLVDTVTTHSRSVKPDV